MALPVILGGMRLTAVISLGTATIGSTVAARTLGEVIIAGLLSSNTAFVLQGGLVVGIIAVLIHEGFQALERIAARRTGLDASAPATPPTARPSQATLRRTGSPPRYGAGAYPQGQGPPLVPRGDGRDDVRMLILAHSVAWPWAYRPMISDDRIVNSSR